MYIKVKVSKMYKVTTQSLHYDKTLNMKLLRSRIFQAAVQAGGVKKWPPYLTSGTGKKPSPGRMWRQYYRNASLPVERSARIVFSDC